LKHEALIVPALVDVNLEGHALIPHNGGNGIGRLQDS